MLVGSTNTLRRQFAQPRVVRTVAFAAKALGNREKAADWLSRPNHVLGGRVPLELLATDVGARAVEEALGRIAWGGVS